MKLDREKIKSGLLDGLQKLSRFRVVIGLLLVLGIYGFLIWRIESLNSVQPSPDAVLAKNNPLRSAHIDTKVVQQLESLRDNSVNVKTIFDQERQNPFQ
ncbi:MAG TPA: hypothetical protein VLG27_01255 [Candidatus Saccharimonadia bacterium]|nr:hypothetical protein [Candidatus Saccharimonadia bacterium]